MLGSLALVLHFLTTCNTIANFINLSIFDLGNLGCKESMMHSKKLCCTAKAIDQGCDIKEGKRRCLFLPSMKLCLVSNTV